MQVAVFKGSGISHVMIAFGKGLFNVNSSISKPRELLMTIRLTLGAAAHCCIPC